MIIHSLGTLYELYNINDKKQYVYNCILYSIDHNIDYLTNITLYKYCRKSSSDATTDFINPITRLAIYGATPVYK